MFRNRHHVGLAKYIINTRGRASFRAGPWIVIVAANAALAAIRNIIRFIDHAAANVVVIHATANAVPLHYRHL